MSIIKYIKSAFLFMNIFAIAKHIIAQKKLYKTTEEKGFNQFYAKQHFNEFQRQEEVVLYGYTLNIEQRETQNKLFQMLKNEEDVHNIFLGPYIKKNGKLKSNIIIEVILFILSMIVTLGITTITLMTIYSIFSANLTLSSKITITTMFLIINSYIAFIFYNRFLLTAKVFVRKYKTIKRLL